MIMPMPTSELRFTAAIALLLSLWLVGCSPLPQNRDLISVSAGKLIQDRHGDWSLQFDDRGGRQHRFEVIKSVPSLTSPVKSDYYELSLLTVIYATSFPIFPERVHSVTFRTPVEIYVGGTCSVRTHIHPTPKSEENER